MKTNDFRIQLSFIFVSTHERNTLPVNFYPNFNLKSKDVVMRIPHVFALNKTGVVNNENEFN